ncbi:MAG TPA: adenosylhomocysteinase [Candidatus Limnocylindrales bacterium]|nr:adenosylhomocysteinase [Candidatus Limnocylindrales bacterium]
MTYRIEWVRSSCRMLSQITTEFERTQPFAGMTIGTGIHLEPKTVALLLTLHAGGAHVVSTGNLNSTQPSAVDYLREHAVTVFGGPTRDPVERAGHLDEVLAAEPHLLLDNGGDLFVRYLDHPYDRLLGGTEETTSGRMRLAPLRDAIAKPVLVINDSPIKQFAENKHSVGQSVVESFMRISNRATNGRRVTVFGYGACGKGVALNFRNNHALVSVVEIDPVKRLEAMFDGFNVPDRDEALASAQIVITVTGAQRVITAADLGLLADDVVLANAGHFPIEIDVADLLADRSVASHASDEGITTARLADGRKLHILGEGHMVNLAGPRPLGNSIESMDLGFSLQARSLEAIANGSVGRESCVVPVPRAIDEQVARSYVELAKA